jgi:hypothetical protein
MIVDEGQLQQTLEQMERMVRVLFTLRREVLPQSRQQFALMAEGPLEQIRRLQQELEAYVDEALQPLEMEMAALDEPAGTPSVPI